MPLAPIKLVGGIHVYHPGYYERERGEQSRHYLAVAVGKSDVVREVPLTEHDILGLLRDGVQALSYLKREREEGE